jgi:hypothetical protein
MAIYGNPEFCSDPQQLYRRNRVQGQVTRIGPLLMLNSRDLVAEAPNRPDAFSSGMASSGMASSGMASARLATPAR